LKKEKEKKECSWVKLKAFLINVELPKKSVDNYARANYFLSHACNNVATVTGSSDV